MEQVLKKLFNLEKVSGEIVFYNPQTEVAKHATRLLWGQGWKLDIVKDDEPQPEMVKKVLKVLKACDFDSVVLRNENAMSRFGYQVNTIYKNEGGEIRIGEANPYYDSKVAKIEFSDNVSAYVWKKFAFDDIHYTIIEKWDTMKVERQLWDSKKKNEVSLQGFNAKIPEKLRIQKVWHHNLGILPVDLFKNVEMYVDNPGHLEELRDDWNVRHLPKAINFTFQTEILEQLTDTTKIFGNFDEASLKRMRLKGLDYSDQILARMFIQVPRADANGGKIVEVQQASLAQLQPLIEARKQNIKDYWLGCGYTYLTGDENLDTNASSLFSKAKDIETTKEKRNLRQKDYAHFIKKIMVAMNLISADERLDYDVSFTIMENVVQSSAQIIESELMLVDKQLQSKYKALANIRDITESEAKAQVKEATNEAEQAQQKQMTMLDDFKGSEEAERMEPNDPKEPKQGA